jgi:hypothetical protein
MALFARGFESAGPATTGKTTDAAKGDARRTQAKYTMRGLLTPQSRRFTVPASAGFLTACAKLGEPTRGAAWTVEERPTRFIISDANGQALAYVYYEEEPGAPPAFLRAIK